MRREREKGLTLVELLISVALLGFILLGIAPLFIASVKSNYSANEYTSINVLARDRLEQLMNLPFTNAQLTAGVHPNDQPDKLPDPTNPSALSMVRSPFAITYQVFQYAVPVTAAVPLNGAFTPTRITLANLPYQYKRIDVTVTAGAGPLGIGARVSRVSGVLANPAPASGSACGTPPLPCSCPGVICSVADSGP